MDDAQALRSMVRDDAYCVQQVFADGPSGRTELVTLDGEGPLVRKRMPLALANASAWAACLDIDEPLLPRIESLYRMPDELVVVYAYVPGDALGALVDKRGRLRARQAVRILRDLCHAVGLLHEHGVVHRDITPGNVIVAADGAHLVDLGIARHHAKGRTHDTTTLGTWGFAAPEQFGFAQTDARSDVYALGCLLGFMLTGIRPGSDQYEATLDDDARVPAVLARVVRRASEFEPSARYQSACELGEAACAALGMSCEQRSQANAEVVAAASVEPFSLMPPGKDGAKAPDTASDKNPLPNGVRHLAKDAGSSATDGSGPQPGPKPATQANAPMRDTGRTALSLSEVPVSHLVAAIVAWLVLALGVLTMIGVMVSAVLEGEPSWGLAQHGMSLACMGGLLVTAREVYCVLVRKGSYASQRGACRTLLHRLCITIVITFIIMCVISIVFPAK